MGFAPPTTPCTFQSSLLAIATWKKKQATSFTTLPGSRWTISLDNLVVAKMLQCHLEQSNMWKCVTTCSMLPYRSLLFQILASENVSWFFLEGGARFAQKICLLLRQSWNLLPNFTCGLVSSSTAVSTLVPK